MSLGIRINPPHCGAGGSATTERGEFGAAAGLRAAAFEWPIGTKRRRSSSSCARTRTRKATRVTAEEVDISPLELACCHRLIVMESGNTVR